MGGAAEGTGQQSVRERGREEGREGESDRGRAGKRERKREHNHLVRQWICQQLEPVAGHRARAFCLRADEHIERAVCTDLELTHLLVAYCAEPARLTVAACHGEHMRNTKPWDGQDGDTDRQAGRGDRKWSNYLPAFVERPR